MAVNPIVNEIKDYVKQQIMTEGYQVGERISERALCEHFGVSRTVIREALFELKRLGWVYAETRSGTYVMEMDTDLMRQNYMARLYLEPQILLLAFPGIDAETITTMKTYCEQIRTAETTARYSMYEHELHKVIYHKCGNAYILDFMSQMMDSMIRIGAKAGRDKERREVCVNEWRGIIEALEQHDPQKAVLRFQGHIRASYEAFCQNFEITESIC